MLRLCGVAIRLPLDLYIYIMRKMCFSEILVMNKKFKFRLGR